MIPDFATGSTSSPLLGSPTRALRDISLLSGGLLSTAGAGRKETTLFHQTPCWRSQASFDQTRKYKSSQLTVFETMYQYVLLYLFENIRILSQIPNGVPTEPE